MSLVCHIEEFRLILGVRDCQVWGLNKKGKISTKSFYEGLENVSHLDFDYKGIWTLGIPLMVKFFFWTSILDKSILFTA